MCTLCLVFLLRFGHIVNTFPSTQPHHTHTHIHIHQGETTAVEEYQECLALTSRKAEKLVKKLEDYGNVLGDLGLSLVKVCWRVYFLLWNGVNVPCICPYTTCCHGVSMVHPCILGAPMVHHSIAITHVIIIMCSTTLHHHHIHQIAKYEDEDGSKMGSYTDSSAAAKQISADARRVGMVCGHDKHLVYLLCVNHHHRCHMPHMPHLLSPSSSP